MRWYQFPIELVRFIGSTPTRLRTFNCFAAFFLFLSSTWTIEGAALGKQPTQNVAVGLYIAGLFLLSGMRWYWTELRPLMIENIEHLKRMRQEQQR